MQFSGSLDVLMNLILRWFSLPHVLPVVNAFREDEISVFPPQQKWREMLRY